MAVKRFLWDMELRIQKYAAVEMEFSYCVDGVQGGSESAQAGCPALQDEKPLPQR